MSRIIFDIETSGKDFDSLEKSTQEYLLRWVETEDDIKDVKESLSFYPLTGEIITIGILNPDTDKGAVYFQSPETQIALFEENGIKFETGTEKGILEKFWNTVKSYKEIITFNGRGFDCPFILIRSAVHKIKPTKDLMPNRYNGSHIDLLDQLTFYGAMWRRPKLHFATQAFGIESPKEGGMDGEQVPTAFAEGKYEEIARYCMADVVATKKLYEYWEEYLNFQRS